MHLRSHRISESGTFLARRLARLEPPYIATVVLVLLLGFLSSIAPGFAGEPFRIEPVPLLAHAAYLNAFLGYDWLNPVFWTLAIEFQFYLFIALIFPLLASPRPEFRTGTVSVCALLGFAGLGNAALLPHWLPLFALGMATYQIVAFKGPLTRDLLALTVIGTVGFLVNGPLQVAASFFAAVAILVFRYRSLPRVLEPLAWAGGISYSLYLLHVPIGGRVINLGMRLPEAIWIRYSVVVVALVVSLAAAACFYRFVERPSQRWSKRFVGGGRRHCEIEQTPGVVALDDPENGLGSSVEILCEVDGPQVEIDTRAVGHGD